MASLFGHQLDSELEVASAADQPGPLGRLRLRLAPEHSLLARPGSLTVWREQDGAGTFAMARAGATLAIWDRFAGSFAVHPARALIEVAPGRSPSACEHRLVTVAAPLLLAERGDLALHAAGLLTDRGAVLFAGSSGSGKSTTAALGAGLGLGVLGDDAAVVMEAGGGPAVWPGGSGLRVTDQVLRAAGLGGAVANGPVGGGGERDHRFRILARAPTPGPPGPYPVVAAIALEERGAALELERIDPVAALTTLVPALVHGGDPAALGPAFERLGWMVERVPAWRARMPAGLDGARGALRELLNAVA